MARVLEPTPDAIDEAVRDLRAGRLVAFPTETVYGLGADTFNVLAIQLVFALKGRPLDNPLIAHVDRPTVAASVAEGWDERCDALAERFWPGPLTLVLRRGPKVPAQATAGLDTIAVRCPRHPVALRLLGELGGPISAPSANRSGHVSPTTAGHVAHDFADVPELLVLDGGHCEVGIESTVLDLCTGTPRVLRPGGVTVLELREVLGEVRSVRVRAQDRSPGTSPVHYAPRTASVLLSGSAIPPHLEASIESGRHVVVLCFDAEQIPPPHRAIEMPQSAGDYAKRLYAALRQADEIGLDEIVIERPPLSNEMWRAILDRLARATAG